MTAEEQMNSMGDFVEGCLNDHSAGLVDINETVVKVTEYFVERIFEIEKNWAQEVVDIAELPFYDGIEKSTALYTRAASVLNAHKQKGGLS